MYNNTNLIPVTYTRKSTDEDHKQILSIDGQKDEMRFLAARNDLSKPTVLEESHTAFKAGRPIFNQMIADINAGKYNVILCWKLDRLARNFEDSWKIITLLLEGKIRKICTPNRVFVPKDNVIVIAVEFASACQFSRDLAENVKRTNDKKMREGIWPGRAPFGYYNDQKERDVKIDLLTAPLVKRAYELLATGRYSIQDIRSVLRDSRIVEWRKRPKRRKHRQRPVCLTDQLSVSQWHRILTSSFYYGVLVYRKELQQGKHKPLIAKALFDRVQLVLCKRGTRKGYKYKPFPFRSLFKCGECGCTVTMEIQKGICYWRCSKRKKQCSQRYIRSSEAIEQIQSKINTLLPLREIPALLERTIFEDSEVQTKRGALKAAKIESEIQHHEDRIQILIEHLTDGTISDDDFKIKKNSWVRKITTLQADLAKIEAEPTSRFELDRTLVSELNEALVLQQDLKQDDLRNFVERIGSNWVLRDGRIVLTLKRRWEIWLKRRSQFGPIFLKKPVGYQLALLRSLRDSVRRMELRDCCFGRDG